MPRCDAPARPPSPNLEGAAAPQETGAKPAPHLSQRTCRPCFAQGDGDGGGDGGGDGDGSGDDDGEDDGDKNGGGDGDVEDDGEVMVKMMGMVMPVVMAMEMVRRMMMMMTTTVRMRARGLKNDRVLARRHALVSPTTTSTATTLRKAVAVSLYNQSSCAGECAAPAWRPASASGRGIHTHPKLHALTRRETAMDRHKSHTSTTPALRQLVTHLTYERFEQFQFFTTSTVVKAVVTTIAL